MIRYSSEKAAAWTWLIFSSASTSTSSSATAATSTISISSASTTPLSLVCIVSTGGKSFGCRAHPSRDKGVRAKTSGVVNGSAYVAEEVVPEHMANTIEGGDEWDLGEEGSDCGVVDDGVSGWVDVDVPCGVHCSTCDSDVDSSYGDRVQDLIEGVGRG